MRTRAKATDGGGLDVAYLAGAFGLTEQDLQTLLETPTVELVQTLFEALTGKAHEHEQLKTEKLKVDVELENTIRTTEAKVKAHKATALKHAKDIEEVRSKLNESETSEFCIGIFIRDFCTEAADRDPGSLKPGCPGSGREQIDRERSDCH
jgi:nucleoprotein TPR